MHASHSFNYLPIWLWPKPQRLLFLNSLRWQFWFPMISYHLNGQSLEKELISERRKVKSWNFNPGYLRFCRLENCTKHSLEKKLRSFIIPWTNFVVKKFCVLRGMCFCSKGDQLCCRTHRIVTAYFNCTVWWNAILVTCRKLSSYQWMDYCSYTNTVSMWWTFNGDGPSDKKDILKMLKYCLLQFTFCDKKCVKITYLQQRFSTR